MIFNVIMIDNILSLDENEKWCASTIHSMFKKEKFTVCVLTIKTYKADVLLRTRVKNDG